MESEITRVCPYVCTECGREPRLAAEVVPDDWDSYKNEGMTIACECTELITLELMRKPHHWVLDTDHEVGE